MGSFVSRCRAGWAFVCRGQRTRSSRSSLESHLSRVDASSAWRVRTVPQAAPRVPGRQERCEGSGVRGWGSGASRVLGSAVRGVCALTRALLSPGIQVPCLSSGLAHTVRLGPGRGVCVDAFGSYLRTDLPLGPQGAAAGASLWAVGSGWPRAVPGGRGWEGRAPCWQWGGPPGSVVCPPPIRWGQWGSGSAVLGGGRVTDGGWRSRRGLEV